jgi:hypothetical protein
MPLDYFCVSDDVVDDFRDVYVEYVERLYADEGFMSEIAALQMLNAILDYYGSNKIVIGFTYSEQESSLVMNVVEARNL